MKQDKPEPLIEFLYALRQKNDRAALAALRHSLAFEPGEDLKVFRYVERFVGKDVPAQSARRRALYAVAGLFALHPEVDGRSFAAAFGELVRRRIVRGSEPDKNRPSTERRFMALLEADADSVLPHLRQAVNLLAREGLGYDHAGLLFDLFGLLSDRAAPDWRDDIKRTWARQFYRALQIKPADEGTADLINVQ